MRPIILCADDYGMAPGVSRGIRELVALGRLNAVSVMVASPHFSTQEAQALLALARSHRFQIGLHVTLSAPFSSLSDSTPFLPLSQLLHACRCGDVCEDGFEKEISFQITRFRSLFAALPAFCDGHQHVQLFPHLRKAFLRSVATHAPGCWVRNGTAPGWRGLCAGGRKAAVLSFLSRGFRRDALDHGLRCNEFFTGTYRFSSPRRIAELFPRFLSVLPAGGVMMCHPGHVDADLEALDPVLARREEELLYLSSQSFSIDLNRCGVCLDLDDVSL